MKLKKSYIKENANLTLKEVFPKLFESELEVGKWYKTKNGHLKFFVDEDTAYGFDMIGNWNEVGKGYRYSFRSDNYWTPATDKEVETALIAEAKRRGFKDGVKIRHILFDMSFSKGLPIINNFNLTYDHSDNSLDYKAEDGQRFRIFKDGKWAEICEEPIELTLEQIAEKFNVNVEQLKIKK